MLITELDHPHFTLRRLITGLGPPQARLSKLGEPAFIPPIFISPHRRKEVAVTFTAIAQQHLVVRNARIVYEPSVFNGTGTEVRRNLVLAVDQAIRNQLTDIEDRMQLGPTRCSVVKLETIRAKVDTDSIRMLDADHVQINIPEEWVHANVDARLEISALRRWKTATNCGISVRCTDIRFCTDEQSSPFK